MISHDLKHTVNIIHIEAPIESVWWSIATMSGSNSYLSDSATSTGDPENPQPGDQFHFFYGDIVNDSVCVSAKKPHSLVLKDKYQSMLPDGTIIPYDLETTFTLEEEGPFVKLTVEVVGYGESEYDLWIRECMETGWRRSLLNLKIVLEVGLDLRNELFGYPRIGITNTGHSHFYAEKTKMKAGTGNYLLECFPGGPAYEAGLRKGDVILEICGIKVDQYMSLVKALSMQYKKKEYVSVLYARDGELFETSVKLSYEDRFTGLIEPVSTNESLEQVRMKRLQTRIEHNKKESSDGLI